MEKLCDRSHGIDARMVVECWRLSYCGRNAHSMIDRGVFSIIGERY